MLNKISKKQSIRNREVAKIKKELSPYCVICGRKGNDACHLLPKSIYPEYYTLKDNIVIMCRDCHNKYDNNLSFRQQQVKLFNQIKSFSPQGAIKYFRLWNK